MSSTGPRPHDDARALRLCVDELRAEPVPELEWDRVEHALLDRIARREPPRYSAPQPQPSSFPRLFGLVAAAAVLALVFSSMKPNQVASAPAAEAPAVDIAALAPAADGDRDFAALAAGDAVETTDQAVTFEQAASVRWTLGPASRAVVRAKGKGGVGHVVALERGWIRAEVTPRDPSEGMVEAFAVEADGTRVAVHGTLFKVTRLDDSILVDVDHGAVAVGPVGHVGITTGRLLVGPARASFSLDGGKTARLMQRSSDAYAALALPEPEAQRQQPTLGQLAVNEPAAPIEETEPAPATRAPAAPVAKAAPAPVAAAPEPGSQPVAAVEPPAPPAAAAPPPARYLTETAVRAQLGQCWGHKPNASSAGSSSVTTLTFAATLTVTIAPDGSIKNLDFGRVGLDARMKLCADALYSGKFEPGQTKRSARVPLDFSKSP